jgi:hypothetical protein
MVRILTIVIFVLAHQSSSLAQDMNTKGLFISFNLVGFSPGQTVDQDPNAPGQVFPETKFRGGYMFGTHFGWGIKQWLTLTVGGDFNSLRPDTYTSGSISYFGGGMRLNIPTRKATRFPFATIEYCVRELSVSEWNQSGNVIFVYSDYDVRDFGFSYGGGLHTKFIDFGYKYASVSFKDEDPSINPFSTHRIFIGISFWVNPKPRK